jgi:hypothetical protein
VSSEARLYWLSDSELADQLVLELRVLYRRGGRLKDALGKYPPIDDVLHEFRARLYDRAEETSPGSVLRLPLSG